MNEQQENKKELRKLLREFRGIANRLIESDRALARYSIGISSYSEVEIEINTYVYPQEAIALFSIPNALKERRFLKFREHESKKFC